MITPNKATDDVSRLRRDAEKLAGKKPTLLVTDATWLATRRGKESTRLATTRGRIRTTTATYTPTGT